MIIFFFLTFVFCFFVDVDFFYVFFPYIFCIFCISCVYSWSITIFIFLNFWKLSLSWSNFSYRISFMIPSGFSGAYIFSLLVPLLCLFVVYLLEQRLNIARGCSEPVSLLFYTCNAVKLSVFIIFQPESFYEKHHILRNSHLL